MKLNAIVILKNEVDIIQATLVNALQFCDNIYLLDNGSDDGSWELINKMAEQEPRIKIEGQTFETYKNQLRNRIYNCHHHEFSNDDWWYILDADELLVKDPRTMLDKADKRNYRSMDVWQAQFYYTDQDLADAQSEDYRLPIPERRKYYQINWRELRFFKNDKNQQWPETVSGRIPKSCSRKKYPFAPICRHYAERTPEQIAKRRKIRVSNPYSFLHVKNKSENDWLKKSADCHYYQPDQKMKVSFSEAFDYYRRQLSYWISWRVKNLTNYCQLTKKVS